MCLCVCHCTVTFNVYHLNISHSDNNYINFVYLFCSVDHYEISNDFLITSHNSCSFYGPHLCLLPSDVLLSDDVS